MSRQKTKKPFNAYPFSYQQELTLEVSALSNLGEGVAKVPVSTKEGDETRSWVVFIPFTLPGETVKVRVLRNEKNRSHAELVEVITPSADRVTPPCYYYTACGGCQYQHLNYEAQLKWKQEQVAGLLNHLGGVEGINVNAPIASPQPWNYRSKITPHIQKGKNGKVRDIGFLKRGTRRDLVDIERCAIAMDSINDALPRFRSGARQRSAAYQQGETLLLRTNEERVYDNPREIMSERVGELDFYFLAGDFFQNNPYILPSFVDYARQQAVIGSRYLIDAYCGSGLFGLSLAKHFEGVSMVEVSVTGADWARYNAHQNGIGNAVVHTASAESIFGEVTYPGSETTVLIDPPRKGCDEVFLSQLMAYAPARVVYISCDPATQARDLKSFTAAGYEVLDVQPVDLFPQTRHLECIITLQQAG